MKRTFVYRHGQFVELTPSQSEALPQVMPDVKEFQSPDGTRIKGRRQWREHLKRTGSVEMGHADIRSAQEQWLKRKEAFHLKVANTEGVKEVEAPDEIRPMERSRVQAEVLNRLDKRPAPDRKTLIKLGLEMVRYLAKHG